MLRKASTVPACLYVKCTHYKGICNWTKSRIPACMSQGNNMLCNVQRYLLQRLSQKQITHIKICYCGPDTPTPDLQVLASGVGVAASLRSGKLSVQGWFTVRMLMASCEARLSISQQILRLRGKRSMVTFLWPARLHFNKHRCSLRFYEELTGGAYVGG